jgi:hypothetical protein
LSRLCRLVAYPVATEWAPNVMLVSAKAAAGDRHTGADGVTPMV